ncbi:MAG: 30S ribosome-binding factor RbfA [Sedimentisphaerales bacterium]
MSTRRQEKVARAIKEAVSDAIANHLNDPRIEGFVSVTRVDVAADLRVADVYLSIFGKDEVAQNKTYTAITHARSRIQSLLAGKLQCKFCPVLRFQMDDKFKKALEIIRLIDETTREREKKDSVDEKQNRL